MSLRLYHQFWWERLFWRYCATERQKKRRRARERREYHSRRQDYAWIKKMDRKLEMERDLKDHLLFEAYIAMKGDQSRRTIH